MNNYLLQEIEAIRQKPAIYLGRISITALGDSLGGFQSALYRLGKEDAVEKLLPLPFWFFHEFVANYYNWFESTAGWKNMILQENELDEEKSFWDFCELFDAFMSLSIQQSDVASLTEENIIYHYTDKFAPKCNFPPDYKERPVYIDPIEVTKIKLTKDAGYLCLVNTKIQYRLEAKIYKREDEIEAYIKQCFGPLLDWKSIDVKNIDFDKKLLLL